MPETPFDDLVAESRRLREEIAFINRGIIALADQYVDAWRERKAKEQQLAEIERLLAEKQPAQIRMVSFGSPPDIPRMELAILQPA
jgi:hypothetical protein